MQLVALTTLTWFDWYCNIEAHVQQLTIQIVMLTGLYHVINSTVVDFFTLCASDSIGTIEMKFDQLRKN